jgi:hypothetical protein
MAETFKTSTPLERITLEQILGEAIGAASTAWIPDPAEVAGGPVFDTEFALSILETVKAYVNENYLPKHLTGEAGLTGVGAAG